MPPKKKTPMKFDRLVKGSSDKEDGGGKVVIFIAIREGSLYRKGNMTKTITIPVGRVSDVYDSIVTALFEE